MTPEQAKRILNIDREDDKAAIRRKYHRLMSAFHPDAAGADKPEHIRRAQEINAAYSLLKKEAKTPATK
ncbi:MAG: DnaJ domain-containing protein, partial [Lachnospiraceae bacterium]|nr:DnaJ domain-containing protein [Lachnospiraceae bacterium]